jgi:DNA-binding NarL/FixJ family response regulator
MGIRVFLVDDHELVRSGVADALGRAGHEVVGEAESVSDARARSGVVEFDAAVVDMRLPDGTGIELIKDFRSERPEVGLVLLTMFPGDDVLFEAMDAGANAVVGKDSALRTIVAKIEDSAADPSSFSATDLAAAMKRRMQDPGPLLTPRELEVLEMLAEGYSLSQLARRLHVSPSTAKTHTTRIYNKLGAANRAQAVMEAVNRGILRPNASDAQ